MQQQLKEMNLDKPAFTHHPVCWALDQEAPGKNSLTPPGSTPKRMRAMPQVYWTPNSTPAQARRWTPQGAKLVHPQPIGTAEGITLCGENITRHIGSSIDKKIDGSVSHCSEKLPKRMPSLIEIGVVKSRTP